MTMSAKAVSSEQFLLHQWQDTAVSQQFLSCTGEVLIPLLFLDSIMWSGRLLTDTLETGACVQIE